MDSESSSGPTEIPTPEKPVIRRSPTLFSSAFGGGMILVEYLCNRKRNTCLASYDGQYSRDFASWVALRVRDFKDRKPTMENASGGTGVGSLPVRDSV